MCIIIGAWSTARNLYDNPDVIGSPREAATWRGDGTIRRVARDKGSSWKKVNTDAKEDAIEYWRRGNDRVVNMGKWTVRAGKETEPNVEFEPSKGTLGQGTIRTGPGEERLITQKEPRGHVPEGYDPSGSLLNANAPISSLQSAHEEADRYSEGAVAYNKNLNRATSGGGRIVPVDPAKGSNARSGTNLRTGDKFIVTDSTARYRIQPSGKYTNPSTGRTDLLRLIFGI